MSRAIGSTFARKHSSKQGLNKASNLPKTSSFLPGKLLKVKMKNKSFSKRLRMTRSCLRSLLPCFATNGVYLDASRECNVTPIRYS